MIKKANIVKKEMAVTCSKKITVVNKLGLHTRAASKLVDCASRYSSGIELSYATKKADAKRILEVMTLGAKVGTELDVTVTGEDEKEAFSAICNLIEERFGESE